MREILFRGKAQNDSEWIEGGYIWPVWWEHDDGKNEKLIALSDGEHCGHVIPETVGQWTGLVDKNGKKIFEGDIVRTRGKDIYLVEWNNDYGGFECFNYETGIDLNSAEVIGNIHDNPELLGKE